MLAFCIHRIYVLLNGHVIMQGVGNFADGEELFSYSLPADTEYTLLVMAIKDKRIYTLLRVLMCTHVPCVLPNCDEYEAAL